MKSSSSRFFKSVIVPVVFALAATSPAAAQVLFDAASTSSPITVSNANPTAISWTHTTGSAKKTYLTVGISIKRNGGTSTVTTVTYGSEVGGPLQAMSLLGSINNGTNVRAEIWGVAAPTAGTHTITISVANPGAQQMAIVAGAKSFSNVFQTNSTGTAVTAAPAASLTPTVTTASTPFDYVVDAVAYNGNVALTPGAGQTNSYNLTSGAPVFSGAGSIETGSTNVTMSWTATGVAQLWATVAVPLHAANPQILFDAASRATTGLTSNANPVVVSWSHTTTTAANRYIVAEISINLAGGTSGTNVTVTGVTYGGTPMGFLGGSTRTTTVRTELWGLAAPASGTNTIAVTVANTGARNLSVTAGAQSFSNVDQNNPTGTAVGNNGSSTVASVSTTSTPYDYVVDVVGFAGNTPLITGLSQDVRWTTNTTGPNFAGGGSNARGYTNIAMAWTTTSANWAIEAIPLKQVAVGVTKTTVSDVVKTGDTITYTLSATNYSAATVNGITISDAIPAGSTFVSQTGCAGTGPVTCTVGSLAPGATSATFTITVVPTSAGTVSNVATLSFTGSTKVTSSETIRTLAEGSVCATPGKDGAGGTLAGIKNDYWTGTLTPTAGATTMTVGARVGGGAGNTITAGDLLIVMQMQDAAFDTTNDETYGEGTGSTRATGTGSGASTALNNAGRWEYVVATNSVSAAGGTLNFTAGGSGGGLLYAYTNQTFATTTTQGQRTYQVIRVPQYTTATLGSTLTALPWNGSTGGILAIDVSGTLTLGGATVSVNGLGFRGGAGIALPGPDASALNTDFRTLAPDSATAPSTHLVNGSKGEGIAGTPRYVYQSGATIGAPGVNSALNTGSEGYLNGSFGRGAPGNAGGGSTDGDPTANGDNSGGGGGGNSGFGGPGGNSWSSNLPVGGQGGGSISPKLTRITMGGGGGAGTSNNGSAADAAGNVLTDNNPPTSNGYYSSGANGGGVIIIRALQTDGVTSATLTANGFSAQNVGRDGSGGGGAGGSVLFTTQMGTLTTLSIQAKGGNGGNSWLLNTPGPPPPAIPLSGERHGPGGGGGGGYILLSSAAASTNVAAGVNGVTTTALDSYGAQPGTPGNVETITGNNVLPGGDGATCAIADLAVTNVVSAPAIQAGSNVTFTQTVKNNGPSPADGVVYMAPIPASSTFVSMSTPPGWTCVTPAVGAGGVVICTTPTLTNGTTANFSLVVNSMQFSPAGYVLTETNSVSSNTPDSNPANNQATASTIIEAAPDADLFADMAVTITQNTNVPVPGGNIIYAQTVSNLGSFTAQVPTYSINVPANTTLQSFTIPPGWTCVPAAPPLGYTGAINCSGTTLASGASVSFPMTVKVNVAGVTPGTTVITAAPSVSSTSRDPYLPNNSASVSATVVAAGSGDLAITLANSPNPLSPGENYTYTAVATNNGPSASPNVTVTIPLPVGTTNFQSLSNVPAGWSCLTPAVGSGGNITCTIASLAAGATATFSPVIQVNNGTTSGTALTSTATIGTTGVDSIAANNSSTATNLVTARTNADMAIVKTDSPDPVGQYSRVTYRLTATNNGPAIATNVTVTDTLPASMLYISANPSIGSCSGTTTIICSLGTLNVGNSQFVDIIVQATQTGTISNTATVSATQSDPIPANNSSTAQTTVLAVTLVRLRDFTVSQDKKNVLISWQTSFESDNLGFNLYRDVSGQRTKINKHLISGSALQSKKHDTEAGHVYRYGDKLDAGTFAQYWLEDVDVAGVHTMHGPVSPIPGAPAGAPNTVPLPGLGSDGAVFASPDGFGATHATTQGTASAAQSKQQLDLAAENGLKIYVTQEGWYRLTRATMAAAGFDPGSDPRNLSLFMLGTEQSIVVDDGGDGKLDANDAIEFYGYPLDSISTGARTYWLRAKKGSENRVAVSKINGADPVSGSVPFTYERAQRSLYFAALTTNGEGTNFFGEVIGSWTTTEALNVGNLDASYGGNATLEIGIQGGFNLTHRIDVAVNGHSVGTAIVEKTDQLTFAFPFPQSYLVAGENTIALTSLNGDDDVSLIVKSRLTYQHLLRADNGGLEVNLPGGRSVTVSGFGSNAVRALDITDAAHPVELQAAVAADPQGGFAATFTTPAGVSRTVMTFDGSRLLAAGELAANTPSSWSDTNGSSNGSKGPSDFYIITNKSFTSAAATLKAARDGQGIATAIVDVDDLYDEFNFGIRAPEAIRSFFQLAQTWKRTPSAALLLGDASMDPRDYFGMGSIDYVPTKLVATSLQKTASDDWFSDINGDGIADIPVGRIPVRTPDEAALVIGKITSRGTPSGAWSRNALFVADVQTDYDFAGVAASLKQLLPSTITSQTINFATTSSAHSDVVNAMNSGNLITTYIGHASIEMWAENVFLSSDASALSNSTRLPVVIALNCLNGYFHDVFSESLAEALLRAPNGGAVAVWASSTLTQPDQQALMGRALFQQLFRTDVNVSLGDAVGRAKIAATDPDVRKSWILFGDPTMKLRP
ncbi:MAG: hypothetical protein QOC81_3530 [Thermoanaerobaculia bacterium]|jgi:uncharacterized repeat protein (TIGR01451 family)|nr:hypothetical protein [Thermoanaerobaculia bacterium]